MAAKTPCDCIQCRLRRAVFPEAEVDRGVDLVTPEALLQGTAAVVRYLAALLANFDEDRCYEIFAVIMRKRQTYVATDAAGDKEPAPERVH